MFELLNIVKILCMLNYSQCMEWGGGKGERGGGRRREGGRGGGRSRKGKRGMDVGRVRGGETGCGEREGECMLNYSQCMERHEERGRERHEEGEGVGVGREREGCV